MELLSKGDASFFGAIATDAKLEAYFETFRGPDGWRTALIDWHDALETRWEVIEYADGVGCAFLTLGLGGEGRHSGVAVESSAHFVIWVRDGMAAGGLLTQDRPKALEAAGLSE